MAESTWRRSGRDTEHFRQSPKSFWILEVLGAAVFGVLGAFVGFWLIPKESIAFWQFGYPTIGGGIGIVLGFCTTYALIFGWNLFRAPYRQRDEARQEVIRKTVELETEVATLKERLIPKLEMFFTQGGSCQESQPLEQGRKGVRRLFRVGIRNGGGAVVQGVQVKLVDIDPKIYPISQQLPILLHRMHGNNQPWETEFDLRPGSEEYIDVVHKEEDETRCPREYIVFWLNPPGLARTVECGHYVLTLDVKARNAIGFAPCEFVVDVDEQGRLHFDPATSDS